VWALPVLFVLVRDGRRGWAFGGYALFVAAPMWWTPSHGGPREYGWHGLLTVVANAYLLAGLAFLGYLTYRAHRASRAHRDHPAHWTYWLAGARNGSRPAAPDAPALVRPER
jgi:hypothetical protein